MSLEEVSKKEVQQQNGNFDYGSMNMLRDYQEEKIILPIMRLQSNPNSDIINIIDGPAGSGKTTATIIGLATNINFWEKGFDTNIKNKIGNPFYFTQVCPSVDPLKQLILGQPFYESMVHIRATTKREDIVINLPKKYYKDLEKTAPDKIKRLKELGVEFSFAEKQAELQYHIDKGKYTRLLVISIFSTKTLITGETLYWHRKLLGKKLDDGSRIFVGDEFHWGTGSSNKPNYEENTENNENTYSDVTLNVIKSLFPYYDVIIGMSATCTVEQLGLIDSDLFKHCSTVPKEDVKDYQKTFSLNYVDFSMFTTAKRWDDETASVALFKAVNKVKMNRFYMDKTHNMVVNSTGLVYTNVATKKRRYSGKEYRKKSRCTDIAQLKKIVRKWSKDKEIKPYCEQILFYDSKDKAVVYDGRKFKKVGNSLTDCISDIEDGKYLLVVCVNSATVGVDCKAWTYEFYFRPINKEQRFLSEKQRVYRCIRFNNTCYDFPYKSITEYEESENFNQDVLDRMNTAEIYFCDISDDRIEEINSQIDRSAYILKRAA
tara:strand:- start:65 stop:1699 length:1635 start_codon:yes stop_codon:yes gene_type:complete